MDPKKDKVEEMMRVEALLKFMDNKIEMKENEVNNLKGDGESIPLMEQIVQVERMTKRDNIDPRKTSVEKWAYIQKDLGKKKKNGTEQ